MAVSGPNGYSSDLHDIEPVGIGNFQGSDNYTATTESYSMAGMVMYTNAMQLVSHQGQTLQL